MTTSLVLFLLAGAVLAQTPVPPLRVTMISLGVEDPARSVRFYTETLGLPVVGKPGEVSLVKAGDVTLVLNQPLAKALGGATPGTVEVIFPVDSVVAAHAGFAKRGCNFIAQPHEVSPGMWAATFTDPDGHRLTLFGPR